MNNYPLVWIMMGVSGSGKTIVGRLLSERLECDFLEGDRRHPLSNISKMFSQNPLQDEDRHQWLVEIENDIRCAITQNREIVMTCSALKTAYRQQLTSLGRVQLVWLNVPKSELEKRLFQRSNHYMKPEMLDSQLAAFEPIQPEENVMSINAVSTPDQIVDQLWKKAIQQFPSLTKPWWRRYID